MRTFVLNLSICYFTFFLTFERIIKNKQPTINIKINSFHQIAVHWKLSCKHILNILNLHVGMSVFSYAKFYMSEWVRFHMPNLYVGMSAFSYVKFTCRNVIQFFIRRLRYKIKITQISNQPNDHEKQCSEIHKLIFLYFIDLSIFSTITTTDLNWKWNSLSDFKSCYLLSLFCLRKDHIHSSHYSFPLITQKLIMIFSILQVRRIIWIVLRLSGKFKTLFQFSEPGFNIIHCHQFSFVLILLIFRMEKHLRVNK